MNFNIIWRRSIAVLSEGQIFDIIGGERDLSLQIIVYFCLASNKFHFDVEY